MDDFGSAESCGSGGECLRGQLGLDAGESIQLLHDGGRILQVERIGCDDRTALPWDRDLVLCAAVRSFPLADTLNLLHGGGRSGLLLYTSNGCDGAPDCEKTVFLRRGEVVFATSNQPLDRLGESLLRSGALRLEQLREIDRAWTGRERLGALLVQRGDLSPGELWKGLRFQVEEIVRSLFAHASGQVYFWEGEVTPDNRVRLSLPTARLVAQGLERRDELLRFLAHLESGTVYPEPIEGVSGADLRGNARTCFEALASRDNSEFEGLCGRVGLDPLTMARTIQHLCLVGVVRIIESTPRTTTGGQSERLRAYVAECAAFLSELVAPIVAVEGAGPITERLGLIVSETAQRFPELLQGLAVGPAADLDWGELERRTLRLSGDRRKRLGEALAELVAYLEFEVKNHPGVASPETFLEALREARAKIEP